MDRVLMSPSRRSHGQASSSSYVSTVQPPSGPTSVVSSSMMPLSASARLRQTTTSPPSPPTAPSTSHVAGFVLSSPFHQGNPSSSRVAAAVPDTMQLTSPSRWGSTSSSRCNAEHHAHASEEAGDTIHKDDAAQPVEASVSGRIGSGAGESSSSCMANTYMKAYDYTRPASTTKLHASPARHGTEAHDASVASQHHGRPAAPSVSDGTLQWRMTRVEAKQQGYSGQARRAQEEAALRLATSKASPRTLLYEGLPYTWRELVPFQCPVTHPELMSYDPTGYHSVVARQTRDIGMRVIDLKSGRSHRSMEGLDLNAERGVTGLSLRKHAMAHRMASKETYPGLSKGLVGAS